MPLEGHLSQLDSLVSDSVDTQEQIYRIGDLSREFGVTLRTLRFYEDRGLISPHREGSTRLYSSSDRARLKIILLAKQVGFSLVDIQELMEIYDRGQGMTNPLGSVLEKFTDQMSVLETQKDEVEQAIVRLQETIAKLREMADNA